MSICLCYICVRRVSGRFIYGTCEERERELLLRYIFYVNVFRDDVDVDDAGDIYGVVYLLMPANVQPPPE